MKDPELRSASHTPLIALVGNPNAGKTSVFNRLTGAHQKVGNYPGVTVEKVEGSFRLPSGTVRCVDVPGLYSLEPKSEDERVAVQVIEGSEPGLETPDLLVYVLDAGNLERNLYVFSQLAEVGRPMLVALTMVDRLKRRGVAIDIPQLEQALGVEVVPVVAHRGENVDRLREAIERNLQAPRVPELKFDLPTALEANANVFHDRLSRAGIDYDLSQTRAALVRPSEEFLNFLKITPELEEPFLEARRELTQESVAGRYHWAATVQKAVQTRSSDPARKSLTDKIDRFLTHRVFGLLFFVGVMYLVFQSIYTFAGPLMELIDGAFGALGEWAGRFLEGSPVLQSLVVDGIIAGVGGMIIFLPQILILFCFIAVLEGSGYLARAAFLMDRLLGWCGLNGRAFIPLLSSFACAIPGIMSARVMPDAKSRLATILVAPLMSCSARLPVYVLLIGAFIEPQFGAGWAGFTLFAMHFLGLLLAIPIAWALNKRVIRGRQLPFLLELPPYQWPRVKDVLLAMYFRGKVFVKVAGTIIVLMSIVIWALSYFPRSEAADAHYAADYRNKFEPEAPDEAGLEAYIGEKRLENSFLGRFGRTIAPVFAPAGFDWRITTAILCAFPAREVVVASMGILFQLGGDVDEESTDLRDKLQRATWPDGRPLMTPWTAVGLMVFFALCCQCMATLATVKRETNSTNWAVFMFCYMTGMAYLGAVLIHQIERLVT